MCASYAYGSGSGAHFKSASSARHHLLRVQRSHSFTTARSHSRLHHQLAPCGSAASSSSQGAQGERGGAGAGAGGGDPTSSRIATCFQRSDAIFRRGVGCVRGQDAGEGQGTDSCSAQDAGAGATKGKWEATSARPRPVAMPFTYWPSQLAPGDEGFLDDEDARSSDADPVSRCLVRIPIILYEYIFYILIHVY